MSESSTVSGKSLYIEQVRQLYSHGLVGIIGTPINGLIVVLILRNVIPLTVLTAWLSALAGITFVRMVAAVFYRRTTLNDKNVGFWGALFTTGVITSGVIWGAGGWFLFESGSLPHQAFVSFVIAGMTAGAVGAYSPLKRASLGYIFPALVPVCVRFVLSGEEMHLAMAFMILLFIALMSYATLRINKTIREAIRVMFKNQELIAEAESKNRELAESQAHLKSEVDSRTAELTESNERLEREIKEKDSMHSELLQAQKMEAVGNLAGGVAHDFNNLLTVIKGNLELAMLKLSSETPVFSDMQEVKDAADRAADLTRQLLLYSRKQPINLKPVNLNRSIESLLKMLKRLIGENIEIRTHLDPGLRNIRADRGTLEQVIMNLTVNARDAMPGGGTLTIRTENADLNGAYADAHSEAREGRFVRLSIEDTGTGMGEETKQHLFEPFYTTKGPGKGTGLGMSVAYGIVKEHAGWINVYSEKGEGTVFTIYIPAAATGETAKPSERRSAIIDVRGSGEHLLVVEDEESVMTVVERVLSEAGYSVTGAETVKQGIRAFQEGNSGYDLLFTDTILPDGTGLELIEHIRREQPGLKMLLGSGYPGEKIHQDIIRDKNIPFIQKPYEVNELLMTVKDILTRK